MPVNVITFWHIDGLEGALSTPGEIWNGSFLAAAGSKVNVIGTFANVFIRGGNLINQQYNKILDHTFVKNKILNSPIHNSPISKSSLWDKLADWLHRMSEGDGSYQDYGIVFTGNNNGSMDLKNRAGKIIDHIDLGEAFLGQLKTANLNFNDFKELLKMPSVLKYVAITLKTSSTGTDVGEVIDSAVKKAHVESPQKERRITPKKNKGGKSVGYFKEMYDTNP